MFLPSCLCRGIRWFLCSSFLFWFGFSSCQVSPSGQSAKQRAQRLPPTLEDYKQELERRIGSSWYRLVQANADTLSLGTTVVRFNIPAVGGRARNLRVISNTGGWMNELIARKAILEFRAPPVPPAVLKELKGESFSMEEAFTIFENGEPTPSPKKR